jgi:hypothetical protein
MRFFFYLILAMATPNHVVVWLDLYIGYVEDYIPLKSYFNSTTAVDAPGLRDVETVDRNIYNLIMASYSFQLDACYYKNYTMNILKTFSNITECLDFIENASALKKRIFLISSSALGPEIIPYIIDNKHVYSTYILLDCLLPVELWVGEYFDVIQIMSFDHELDLLTRLTRDIAAYYEDKSLNDIDPKEKISYLRWARKLYVNANANSTQFISRRIVQQVEGRIEELEHILKIRQAFNDDDDEEGQRSAECDER